MKFGEKARDFMKKTFILLTACFLILALTSCGSIKNTSNDGTVQDEKVNDGIASDTKASDTKVSDAKVNDGNVKEAFYKSGTDDSNYVELKKIADNFWLHISYANYPDGTRLGSNGLLAVTSKGLVLIDTPWNNDQTKELLKLTKSVFQKNITLAVITHAHADRIGGIDTLLENGIKVKSTELTALAAEMGKFQKPEPSLEYEDSLTSDDIRLDTFYPGPGHSMDNIVVWFPQSKVLFGGCLVKTMSAKEANVSADSDPEHWADSLKLVLDKYKDASLVIPGHGETGGVELLEHTYDLAKELKK